MFNVYKPTQPTPAPIQFANQSTYAQAANSLLKTVDFSIDDIRNWAILDSGATSNFLITEAPADDEQDAATPLRASLPDGTQVLSTKTCKLQLRSLPPQARLAHKMPSLAQHSLVSVTTLTNAGCQVNFTQLGCIITYRGRTIVCGRKCTRTGLWMIPISDDIIPVESTPNGTTQAIETAASLSAPTSMRETTTSPYETEYVIESEEVIASMHQLRSTMSQAELAMFYHQCFGSPPKSTLLKAIKNKQLSSFPGLTYELISRHLPASTATAKSRMRRMRQGVQSTRVDNTEVILARQELEDMNPTQEICSTRDFFCFTVVADRKTGMMFTDQTGNFPARSFNNMKYIFVAYVYDANAILTSALPNKTKEAHANAFKQVLTKLKKGNCKPRQIMMDNECSKLVREYIETEGIDIQFCPPDDHKQNGPGERAVSTAKEYFIGLLATVDPMCPIQLWDEFLEQLQIVMNLLRTSRRDPSKSAYEDLFGQFDYNKTPIAVVGSKALAYDAPSTRTTFAPHATDVYYVGPALQHYRCLRFWNTKTKRFRITNTYQLFPAHCTLPTISEADKTLIAAEELLAEFKRVQLSPNSAAKMKFAKTIDKLTEMLTESMPEKYRPGPRVQGPTTSHDITAPENVRRAPLIHQRSTRSNTPIEQLGTAPEMVIVPVATPAVPRTEGAPQANRLPITEGAQRAESTERQRRVRFRHQPLPNNQIARPRHLWTRQQPINRDQFQTARERAAASADAVNARDYVTFQVEMQRQKQTVVPRRRIRARSIKQKAKKTPRPVTALSLLDDFTKLLEKENERNLRGWVVIARHALSRGTRPRPQSTIS
ncbi:hypothetical protein THAOC_08166 [Thalassiosira oceanica]|uniref:Integrase catalytic domain-containing protein n=1 Tax=Thalassiosira oceanica TaxID=159749 RepID=K0SZR3_THAOC|nr:hypothetical protein THAOC_08166 [Thalassiosira oceanica]|eukprot:EJK70474.1 hypothetical protein THAOC_08166 [Thalassiosira oceanica]